MASRRTVFIRDRMKNCTARKLTHEATQARQVRQAELVAELVRKAKEACQKA